MKILHVIFSFQTGGSELMLVDIMNNQCRHNNASIHLIIINRDYDENIIKTISPSISITYLNRKKGSKNIIDYFRFNYFIRKINPEIIHFHNQEGIKLLIGKNKKKTFLTVHDIGLDLQYIFEYSTVFSISKAVYNDIRQRSGLISTTVYNGIDFSYIKVKKCNTHIPGTFRILQISRLDHTKKGQDILINALSILKEKLNPIDIVIEFIGEGNSLDYLKMLVKKLSLENHIKFLGLKDRPYINENLQNYDLLVQPSLYEGFGLTIIEAMAAKLPVLVSNIDGPMEIIDNGNYGYCFRKGDAADCARMIDKIANDPDRTTMIEKAYNYAYNNFTIVKTADKYFEAYKK